MERINVYDYDSERIDDLCEKHNLTTAELIELLLDNCDENSLR